MNYYAVVFLLRPPDLLRREPLFEGTDVCNSQENGVRTRRAAIVNHYAIVNLLRLANLLRRSIFSTAGSFGFFFSETARKRRSARTLFCLPLHSETFTILLNKRHRSGNGRCVANTDGWCIDSCNTLLAWPPLQSLAVNFFFFCANFGR